MRANVKKNAYWRLFSLDGIGKHKLETKEIELCKGELQPSVSSNIVSYFIFINAANGSRKSF